MFIPTVTPICPSDIGLARAECEECARDQGPALDDTEWWWLATVANGCGCQVPGFSREYREHLRWRRTVWPKVARPDSFSTKGA